MPAKVAESAIVDASDKLAIGMDIIAERLVERLGVAAGNVPFETAKDMRDGAVALGITIEKRSFLRGGPTARTASLHAFLVGNLNKDTDR
jgi:hypothetical protein